jgi:glutamyl-tRNA synthetase
MVFRLEDLDPLRCKPEYCDAAQEDLRWLGLTWAEGPDVGGPCGPYRQSERRPHFLAAWRALRDGGWIYPCARSRKEVATAALAPHEEEPVFPPEWRVPTEEAREWADPAGTNWRFRVPDGEAVEFVDGRHGPTRRVAGVDFGDFLIWNRDNVPAYELAVVVDDIAMGITEVVRGADLLTSTARQLLLYRALGAPAPGFYHCPLVVDELGRRLAKRTGALALRTLREQGATPQSIWDRLKTGMF